MVCGRVIGLVQSELIGHPKEGERGSTFGGFLIEVVRQWYYGGVACTRVLNWGVEGNFY